MCWEDIVIKRRTKSKIWSSTATQDIPGNGKRVGLWLSANSGGVGQLFVFDGSTSICIAYVANALAGAVDTIYSRPVYVGLDEIGDLLYSPLRVTSAGGLRVTLVETWIDDPADVAKKALERP